MKEWHSDHGIDVTLKRGVSAVVILGACLSCLFWLSATLATEDEAHVMDVDAMDQHLTEIAGVPYAMKSDIDVLADMMVNEKIKDASEDVQEIDDMIIDETAEASDMKKRSRLLKDIRDYEKELSDRDQ
jgi:3-keto-L-gulonate-6-phosphate decarboxylase